MIDPRRLSQALRGEVDWIVMKCLEKDRNRRYESPNRLAADIARYLNDEPVHACPPSAAYRVRKFAQRNTLGIVAGSTIALSLVAALVISTIAMFREKVARERAVAAEREQVYLRQQAETEKRIAQTEAARSLQVGAIHEGYACRGWSARSDGSRYHAVARDSGSDR